MTDEQKAIKNAEYIEKAKETVGKVVRLEFKEVRTSITDADRAERKALMENAKKEVDGGMEFPVIGKKYRDCLRKRLVHIPEAERSRSLPADHHRHRPREGRRCSRTVRLQ